MLRKNRCYKKITAEDLDILKETLSSSSMALQPYKVILVENPELRAKNTAISFGTIPNC
jgi:nitroreductase